MWGRILTRLLVRALKNARIGNEDRQILTSAILQKLGALPLRARIMKDATGQIFVDGKLMNAESALKMRDTARSMLNNFARRFVRETVTFLAVKQGVHENTSPEQGLFAKAALWFYAEEDILYRELAGLEPE